MTSDPEGSSSPKIYQVYGLDLISAYPFASRLYRRVVEPGSNNLSFQLLFYCTQSIPFPVDWDKGRLIYYWGSYTSKGEKWNRLYRFDTFDVLRLASDADFYISSNRIDCHLRNPAYRTSMELDLLGTVLVYWLERRGSPALHASAVEIDGRTAAFLSDSGNGKSTLAAAFMQAGAAFLTDDILPVEQQAGIFWGFPGLPQVNFWPDQAAYFTDNEADFERVVPEAAKKRLPIEAVGGVFCDQRQPLASIYILSQSGLSLNRTRVEIIPVPPAEAVIELVRYSFITPAFFGGLGWQARRLDFFARLVQQVPVRRLVYSAGFEHLPYVIEAVLHDLQDQPRQQ